MNPTSATQDARAQLHTPLEDAQALLISTLFVALGLALYRHAGLLTGGTAGMAFLIYYVTHWNFGLVFFIINLPFYWLAVRAMGWAFTLKSFAAIGLVSLFSEALPHWIDFGRLNAPFAAIMGGFLIGTGLLMLFRHKASLGGVGVLAVYLQNRRGWRAGKIQMAIDCCIVLSALTIVTPDRVAVSVLGAVAMNLILAVNHKPGRYLGV